MIFGFSKKNTLKDSRLFQKLIDFHTHLLPGVDDGVETTEESLQMLGTYQSMGVKKVILTPHVMEDYPLNNKEYLICRFNDLRKEYTGNIEIALGAEYMLDNSFERHLTEGDLLTIAHKEVLTETSYMYAPMNFWGLLNQIHTFGYYIVLAHPERYTYLQTSDYNRLKQMGVRFQLNILSPTGYYGEKAKITSQKLLEMGYYDYLGSDLHDPLKFYEAITQSKISNRIICMMKEIVSRT